MTHLEQLQRKIDFWAAKLGEAERAQTEATTLITDSDDPNAATALLQQSTTEAMAARAALAALEAKRSAAQAADLEEEADALTVEADALKAQAAPIAAEVERLIEAAAAVGVNLVRRGAPQRDLELQQTAAARLSQAREHRAKAATLRGTS